MKWLKIFKSKPAKVIGQIALDAILAWFTRKKQKADPELDKEGADVV